MFISISHGFTVSGDGGGGVQGRHGQKPYDLLVSVLEKMKRYENDRSGCPEGREGEREKDCKDRHRKTC